MNANGQRPISSNGRYALEISDLHCYYDQFRAVKDVHLKLEGQKIRVFIDPSGCGKSTVLRALNRINDLIPGGPGRGSSFISWPKPI